jgi:hypothetical protein
MDMLKEWINTEYQMISGNGKRKKTRSRPCIQWTDQVKRCREERMRLEKAVGKMQGWTVNESRAKVDRKCGKDLRKKS